MSTIAASPRPAALHARTVHGPAGTASIAYSPAALEMSIAFKPSTSTTASFDPSASVTVPWSVAVPASGPQR